jgi:hypothetical protein
VFPIYRTQLFSPDDLDNVKKVQAGYKAVPLSAFLGQPAPTAAPLLAEGCGARWHVEAAADGRGHADAQMGLAGAGSAAS